MGDNVRTKFVGMDVHQKSISIAIADDGPDGEVRLYGTITNTGGAIDKAIRKLVSTGRTEPLRVAPRKKPRLR